MTFTIVDHDLDDRYIFRELLKDLRPSSKVTEAEDGPALFRLLEADPNPDYIFIDIDLPGINGWECIRILKGNPIFAAIPIIVYSSSISPAHFNLAMELGALCYCRKTYEEGQLQKLLPILLSSDRSDISNAVAEFNRSNQC